MRLVRSFAMILTLAAVGLPATLAVVPAAWAGSSSDDCCKGK
jgi:hypothetical protein